MNELLGWYGYDRVDYQDTQHLDLQQFMSSDRNATDRHAKRPSSGPAKEATDNDSGDDSTATPLHPTRGQLHIVIHICYLLVFIPAFEGAATQCDSLIENSKQIGKS